MAPSELPTREQLALHAVDRLCAPLVIVSKDCTVLLWNEAAASLFGYSKEEAEGRPLPALIYPPSGAQHDVAIEEAAKAGSAMHVAEYRKKSGAPLPLAMVVDAVADHDGPPEYFVLTPRQPERFRAPPTAPAARRELGGLTARQREVLQLIAEGRSTREIAQRLKLSVKTVETHRAHLMQRLRVDSVAKLVRYAVSAGLVPLTL